MASGPRIPFSGVLLVVFGALFLADQLGALSFGQVFATWWPALLVLAGLLNLIERPSTPLGPIIMIAVGAGLLLANLPNARALIHPRGARHLINAQALVEGARAVYGPEEVLRTYGEIVPIPAERVVESHDGMGVMLGVAAALLEAGTLKPTGSPVSLYLDV